MRAISVLSFDAGTSTRACLARAALRMRVSKSEMGSVCIFFSRPLPASLQHAGDFAQQRQTAEADAAHLELAQVPARPAAYAAAVAHADLELRLPAHLGALTGSRHRFSSRPSLPLYAERHAQQLEQLASFLVVARRGGQGDIHALDLVHPRVVNFREDELVAQAQGIVAATVEGVGRQTLEVAHARQHHVAEPVHELVHTVATQGHAAANRHPLADLEVRNRLLRAGDDRLLPGDLRQLYRRHVEQFDVLAGFAEADVDDDLGKFGYGHRILVSEALHQRRDDIVAVTFA